MRWSMSQRYFRGNQIYRVALLCLCFVPFAAANDWKYEETRHDAREFVSGGFVHVRSTVGDVHIKRGDSRMIRLEYRVRSRSEHGVKEARADFDVHGNNATIEFHSPSSGNTNIDVEL